MKIYIERKPKKIKNKKKKIIHMGTHKKSVLFLWGVLITSITFGVYKNFTVIDKHVVYETKTIKEKIINTTGIENFVINFVYDFYSWDNSKEGLDKRVERVNYYLTRKLQQVNDGMIRSDIPTSSSVMNAQIWNVENLNDKNFSVIYTVEQKIKEKNKSKVSTTSYKLVVHQDSDNNLVIIKNPVSWSKPNKSSYEIKDSKENILTDNKVQKDIENFLAVFFEVYPRAKKEELDYYCNNSVIPIMNDKDKILTDIDFQGYKKIGNSYEVKLLVKYLDQKTKAILSFDYEVILEKNRVWMINRFF